MENVRFVLKQVLQWFVAGLLILLPLGATLILLGWAWNFLDQLIGGQSIFASLWTALFGWLPGGARLAVILGYLFLFCFIVFVGYFARGYAKNKIVSLLRGFFGRIPIVNKIYFSVEQVINLWDKKNNGNEELSKVGEVVMVDFANVKALGVLSSRQVYHMNGEGYYLVYLPSAPVPATGFTYFFKTSDVHACSLKMDEMTRIVVSLGVLGHDIIGDSLKLEPVPVGGAPAPVEMPETPAEPQTNSAA